MLRRSSLNLLALLPAAALAADVETSGDVTPAPATSPIWNPAGNIVVGDTATGSLTIGGGGSVSAAQLRIGKSSTGTGTVELSGNGALTISDSLFVGGDGQGTLRLGGNASVSSKMVHIGAGSTYAAGSGAGLLEVNGGSLGVSEVLQVGGGLAGGGTGTLKITGGSVSTSQLWFYSSLGFAFPFESNSTVEISGGRLDVGSSLEFGEYNVGFEAGTGSTVSASLLLSGSGVVTCTDFMFTTTAGKSATMTIAGGSLIASESVFVGAGRVPFSGRGDTRLEITGGSISSVDGGAAADAGGSSVIRMSGGEWTLSGSLQMAGAGQSRLELTGGTISAFQATLQSGVVEVSGGRLDVGSILYVGGGNRVDGLTAALEIRDDGVVTSDQATIGFIGTGIVRMSGGTWTNAGMLDLGSLLGDGTLEITGGAASALSARIGYVPNNAETWSRGLLRVTGGSWSSASLFVGYGGTGTLEIDGTGKVTPAFGTTVAHLETSTGSINLRGGVLTTSQVDEGLGDGTVTFDGGTLQLTVAQNNLFHTFETGDVTIAAGGGTIDTQNHAVSTAYRFTGAGTLAKDGGGTLTLNTATTLGGYRVRNGTLALAGGGAWTATNDVTVGYDGAGTLSLAGSLASSTGNFGYAAGSSGQMSIGPGSSWTLASDLTVGRAGAGSLTMDGGIVYAHGLVTVGALSGGQGTITLRSGTFNTVKIAEGAGSGSLVFNGGTLLARRSEADFLSGFEAGDVTIQSGGAIIDTNGFTLGVAAPIGGIGSLTMQGGGSLTLSGANTYSGGTIVSAGLLRVADDGTIGNGASLVGAGVASLETGGLLYFYDNSSAGSGTITNAGASVANAFGGVTSFYGNASAGSARLIANNGSNGGRGGIIAFLDNSSGGAAQVEVHGGGRLNIASHTGGGVSIGSLGGDGVVLLGANKLSVGSLNNVTTFAGVISGAGSFAKIGAGGLTLSGANTYTGPTTVEAGSLFVTGSLTSPVTVKNGATFGGDGIVDAITLESGAMLSPVGSLEADSLTWNSGATLAFGLGDGFGDVLDLDGAFTKGDAGSFDFIFVDLGWEFGRTYTLVTFGGTNFTESDFGIGNGDEFGGTFTLTDHALLFTLTAPIPEPASFGFLAAGAGLAAAALRRRRRS